eukprot:403348557
MNSEEQNLQSVQNQGPSPLISSSIDQSTLLPQPQIKTEQTQQAVPSFLNIGKQPLQTQQSRNNLEEEKGSSSQSIQDEMSLMKQLEQLIEQTPQKLTQEKCFHTLDLKSNEVLRDSYIKIWIDYAELVRDTDKVIEFMIEHRIGHDSAAVYTNLAFHQEKFTRNFDEAAQTYKRGLDSVQNNSDHKKLYNKFLEFSSRMELRTQRDVIKYLGEDKYNQMRKNKKRKLDEAFPECDFSVDSNNSNQAKRRQIQRESEQIIEQVSSYKDGIQYLKINNQKYNEPLPAEETKLELMRRPISWLASQAQDQRAAQVFQSLLQTGNNQTQVQVKQDVEQSIKSSQPHSKSLQSISDQQTLSKNQVETLKQQQHLQQQNVKHNKLEEIGEISQDFHSSNASVLHNRTVTQRNTNHFEESKNQLSNLNDDTKLYQTANNSFNCDLKNSSMSANNVEDKWNQTMMVPQRQPLISNNDQQLKSQIIPSARLQGADQNKPQCSIDNPSVSVLLNQQPIQSQVQSILQSMGIDLNYMQQQELNNQIASNFSQFNQFDQPSQHRTTSQFLMPSNPINTQNLNPNRRQSQFHLKSEEVKSRDDQKRISGLFMNLVEESPAFVPQINQFKALQTNQPDLNQSNMSFVDATPIQSKFARNLNPNYSQELILKKRTLSQGRLKEQINDQNQNQNVRDRDGFMSSFGYVSPIPANTRNSFSNYYQDNNRVGLSEMKNLDNHQSCQNFFQDNRQLQQQPQPAQNQFTSQQPVFHSFQQNTQNQQSQNQFQVPQQQQRSSSSFLNAFNIFSSTTNQKPENPQVQCNVAKRDSLDSMGQEFKDCLDATILTPNNTNRFQQTTQQNQPTQQSFFQNYVQQTNSNSFLNQNQNINTTSNVNANSNTSRIPSALKGSNWSNVNGNQNQNLNSDENSMNLGFDRKSSFNNANAVDSRTGSKSVRFQGKQ